VVSLLVRRLPRFLVGRRQRRFGPVGGDRFRAHVVGGRRCLVDAVVRDTSARFATAGTDCQEGEQGDTEKRACS